jgi:hypothetical protein
MTNHFIALFRLARAALGGGAGLVGGAAAGSAGDASAAGLCLWLRLGCPGQRRISLRLVVLHRVSHFGLLLVGLTFVGCIRR